MEKGLSIEEIADTLKISKGEILLIKELYLE
jgi:cytoskeletal protein RodZ